MKKRAISPDEQARLDLDEASRELDQRREELEESQRRAEADRHDQENTLPPSDIVSAIQSQNYHNDLVSRNGVRNARRERGKSLLLLVLLTVMTAVLLWWGLQLMQGA